MCIRDRVAGDEGLVSLGGSAVLDSANVGGRTATVTYTLTGARAQHYTLVPASSTKTVNITKAAMPADASASGTLTITNDLAKTYLFNLRNLTLDPVSYTHLDVYKRQVPSLPFRPPEQCRR